MKVCTWCGEIARHSPCPACSRAMEKTRNADPKRAAYKDPAYRAAPRFGRCVDCGAVGRLTIDHIVPLAHGGRNDPTNWQLLCRPCNSRKGARPDGSQGRSEES